jgi:hypothetical protein
VVVAHDAHRSGNSQPLNQAFRPQELTMIRKSPRFAILLLLPVFVALLLLPLCAHAQTRQINSSGSTTPVASPTGVPGIANPELDPALAADDEGEDDLGFDIGDAAAGSVVKGTTRINRTIAIAEGRGHEEREHARAAGNPQVRVSFEGLNFFNQRFANNGNQFSVEPPDQALCAGNGFVLESVNDVLNIYRKNGSSVLGVVDLNSFYGYPAAINRTTGADGPSITDPTCHFDPDSRRWFHVVLTLDRVGTTAALSGKNHLDIAVSSTANPLDPWTVFKIPVQNDGTDGTPDHNCQARVRINGVNTLIHAQCLGDYPHIGMDKNALFITTNEFELFSPGRFKGSQIYAVSKRGLVSGGPVNVVEFDTGGLAPSLPFGVPGFTVFPALSPDHDFNRAEGGSEFALSSLAVFTAEGAFDELVLWDVSNTSSLNTSSPNVKLTATTVNTQLYAVPPASTQKAGDFPLGQCLADGTISTPLGVGCWRNIVVPPPAGPFPEHITALPSNDSRMQQVSFARGVLYGALDSAVTVNGANKAGAAWFVIQPLGGSATLSGTVLNQGIVAQANNNVTYPAIAVNHDGRGIMAFTVLGDDHFPSAGFTTIDAVNGAGPIHIAAEGAGPSDGFTGYPPVSTRPRWGDYGAAAIDDDSIWFASEYIAQTCDLATYVATNFTCGNTRAALGNWSTHITRVKLNGED